MGTVDLAGEALITTDEARGKILQLTWRDKLCVNIAMDSVTLLDKLSRFFNEVKSIETDPNTGKLM